LFNFDEIWQKYSKDSRIEFACFSFYADLLFLSIFSLSDRTSKIKRILTLYQANAATLLLFSKEGTILKKNLNECKGYNAGQFITEFPDKGSMKSSINGEVEKVRYSRHVNKEE